MGIVVVAPLRATSQRYSSHRRATDHRDELAALHCPTKDSTALLRCGFQSGLCLLGVNRVRDNRGLTLVRVRSPPKPALHRPQSSSASRFTAAHAGFFILSQSDDLPLR